MMMMLLLLLLLLVLESVVYGIKVELVAMIWLLFLIGGVHQGFLFRS